ncbi:MAG: DUF1972 domain-containing protein [Paludibacteraceae bacterium]|nr:DUF1972 domain-containing protein [Paludibacteraceae bacterium]
MKIAFVSTRGIPNNYGGFEQFAEYISVGLVERGHEVTVYSPEFHMYKDQSYKGVRIKHIYSPEQKIGSSIGSFFYDFLSLKDALKKEKYDIIYEAGYTSIIPAFIWYRVNKIKSPIIVTNMDGLEFKRSKFNPLVRRFLAWEERMAVKYSHYLISDNVGIQDYYKRNYAKESKFLAYGADIHDDYDESVLKEYDLASNNYYLIIARMEPENNIEMVIEGYLKSSEKNKRPLIIVGGLTTKFAKKMLEKYKGEESVRFIGGIYDFNKINSIRHFCYGYFHGHSVGGTNPSLLEAMASECFIFAHDNEFNKSVLKENSLYFDSSSSVSDLLNNIDEISSSRNTFIANNIAEIKNNYSWDRLVDQHEKYFKSLLEKNV